jgi:hypothetical protein
MKNVQNTALYNSAINYADGDYIFVKPICDLFQINYDSVVKRFQKDPILKFCTSKMTDKNLFGDNYERLVVSKMGLLRWIQIINGQTITPSLREKFLDFQKISFELLYGGNILKDQYIQYVKKEIGELDALRKEYSRQGNEIKKKKFHIEKVMGMEPGEWKELVAHGEPAAIEGGE